MNLRAIVTGLLAVLLVIFTLQNARTVEIRFLVWTIETSRVVVLFAVFGGGIVVGWLGSSLSRMRSTD